MKKVLKPLCTIFLFCFMLFVTGCKKTITISFESNGGFAVPAIETDGKTEVSKPDDPTKEGYTFIGWYSDEQFLNKFTFPTIPSSNITLYAKWRVNQYTISFDSMGGSEVSAITQDYNTTVTKPDDSTREGYTL